MDKTYSAVGSNAEGGVVLNSGGGSSLGSQWEEVMNADEVRSIITSSLQNIGFQVAPRNGGKADGQGEMSLEEEINSLEINRISIKEEEIQEMEKQQADAAAEERDPSSVGEHSRRKNEVGSSQEGPSTNMSQLAAPREESTDVLTNNDILDDINSVIASSMGDAPASGWEDSQAWSERSSPCMVPRHGDNECLVARKQGGNERDTILSPSVKSPQSSSDTGATELLSPVHHSHQSHLSASSPLEEACHHLTSPYSPPGQDTRSTTNTAPSPLSSETGQAKSLLTIGSPLDALPSSRQRDAVWYQELGVGQELCQSPSRSSTVPAVSSPRSVGVVCGLLDSVGNLPGHGDQQGGRHVADHGASTHSDLELDTGCIMCPVEYDDGLVDSDPDEHCFSGELVAHGKGSGPGRPKTVPPTKSSVFREILPKTTHPPPPTIASSPIAVLVRKGEGQNCLEVRPVIPGASSDTTHSFPLVVTSGITPGNQTEHHPVQDCVSKGSSMEYLERDGLTSIPLRSDPLVGQGHLAGHSHVIVQGQGRLPPHGLPHLQDYHHVLAQASNPPAVMRSMAQREPPAATNRLFRQPPQDMHYQQGLDYQYVRRGQLGYPPSLTSSEGHLSSRTQGNDLGLVRGNDLGLVHNSSDLRPVQQHLLTTSPAHSHQPSATAYQEPRPNPPHVVPASVPVNSPEGSNLILVDRSELEKVGIRLIEVSQPSVPGQPVTAQLYQQQQQQPPPQRHASEPMYVQRVDKGRVYHSAMLDGYQSAVRVVKPCEIIQPAQFAGQIQRREDPGYYITSSNAPNVQNVPSIHSSSNAVCPVPKQHVHSVLMPTPPSRGIPEESLRQGSVPLPSHSSTSSSSWFDCQADKRSRTKAWILDNPELPNLPQIHQPDAHPFMEPSVKAGASKSKRNPGATQSQGKRNKPEGKGRSSRKVKSVNSVTSHQEYVNQFPGKAPHGMLDASEPAGVNDVMKANAEITKRLLEVKMQRLNPGKIGPQNHVPVRNGMRVEEGRPASNEFAQADKEIDKIIEENFKDRPHLPSPINNPRPLDAVNQVKGTNTTSGMPSVSLTTQAVMAGKGISYTYIINPDEYLNAEDRENLVKTQLNLEKSSLDKYLQDKNSLDKLLANCNGLNKPTVMAGTSANCVTAPLTERLNDFGESADSQLPKEIAKIDIFRWAHQSGTMHPDILCSGPSSNTLFDMANPTAQDFPSMLQSLTNSEDEAMNSASLGCHSASFGNQRNPHHHAGATTLKHVTGHKTDLENIPSLSSRGRLSSSGIRTAAGVPVASASPRTDPDSFRRPGPQTGSRQSVSASASHPHPVMSNSLALTNSLSQPMSSLKGESDVSMQSDLSRQGGRDRSMNSVNGSQRGSHQGLSFGSHPNSPLGHPPKALGKGGHHVRGQKVRDWLESQAPFLNHQEQAATELQNSLHHCQSPENRHPEVHASNVSDHQRRQQQQLMGEAGQRQSPQLQHHQVLMRILPPASSAQTHHQNASSPYPDSDGELAFDPFDAPCFSPIGLTPRSGMAGQTQVRCPAGSPSTKGQSSDAATSARSQTQADGSKTSVSRRVSSGGPRISTQSSVSVPEPQEHCSHAQKDKPNQAAISQSSVAASSPPLKSTVVSSPPSVSVSSQAVRDNPPKACRSLSTSSRMSTSNVPVTPNTVQCTLSNDRHDQPRGQRLMSGSSDKTNDVIIVEEKIKSCVNISSLRQKEENSVEKKEEDEEEDEEEEEVSFSGSDVFRPDNEGETILHCICDIPVDYREDLATAPGFKEAVNMSNKAQQTPLFVGVHNRRPDVAKFLIQHGADPAINCISPCNSFRSERLLQSVLHEAAELGDVDTLKVLLKSDKSDIDQLRPASGLTPLMVALHVHASSHRILSANRTKVVELLLKRGVSLTFQDTVEGKTAFLYAIQSRDVSMVRRFLTSMEADEAREAVTSMTSRGATCLHFAASLTKFDRSQKVELIRILILAGADASARNAEGESPRDWAPEEFAEVFKNLARGK